MTDKQYGKLVKEHSPNSPLLRDCGFGYVCTFEKMKPVFHKI